MVHRLVAGYGTPEGRAAGQDLADFATGGVTFAHVVVETATGR